MADSKGAVPLNPKQMKWAEHYAATGNALQSAISAGYSAKSARSQSDRMLKNAEVMRYVAELTQPAQNARIATAQERQEFWTAVMRGDVTDESGTLRFADRLKASELLSKAQGEQVEKHVVTGAGGGPVQTMTITPDDLEGLDAQALARLYFGGKG